MNSNQPLTQNSQFQLVPMTKRRGKSNSSSSPSASPTSSPSFSSQSNGIEDILDSIYRNIRSTLGILREDAANENHSDAVSLFVQANKILFYILDHQQKAKERRFNFKNMVIILGNLLSFVHDIYSFISTETSTLEETERLRKKSLGDLTRNLSLLTLQILLIVVQHSKKKSIFFGIPFSSWIVSYMLEHLISKIMEQNNSPFASINNLSSTPLSYLVGLLAPKEPQNDPNAPLSFDANTASIVLRNLELGMKYLNMFQRSREELKGMGGQQVKKEGRLKFLKDFFVVQTVVALTAIAGGTLGSIGKRNVDTKPKSAL